MLFSSGFILGFSIAAPVGPIGVLCIRRSLRHGWLAGFVSGLGAATADMLYGSVAAFGLQAVSDFLIRGQTYLRGLGGLFLLFLGVRIFLSKPAHDTTDDATTGLLGSYLSTFLLTITNPLTILSFAAIFAAIIPPDTELTTASSLQMVLGVLLGSSTWWLVLAFIAGKFAGHLSGRLNQWIQWASGGLIVLFGLAALFTLLPT